MAIDFEKLKYAYAVIDGIPEAQVDLDHWTTYTQGDNECNTVACAAGWLIRHHDFQVPGFELKNRSYIESVDGVGTGYDYVSALFHIRRRDAEALFRPSYAGAKPDKTVWQSRVRNFLRKYGEL